MHGAGVNCMSLEPIEPDEAVELYLNHRRDSVSEHTLYAHKSRLGHFVRWCESNGIDNLNDLSGRDIHRFRMWRRDDGGLNNVTLSTQLSTLRVFLGFAESIDAVEPGLDEKVLPPSLSKRENSRDVKIDPEEAFDILDYLRKYEYADPRHVVFELMWHTGMRIGTVHGLDLGDYNDTDGYLVTKHRPESGTPLKNKEEGHRLVGLSAEICGLVDDYVGKVRHDVHDEFGRDPLITTESGRPHKTTIRNWIYEITRPCYYGGECPVGRDMESCEAATRHDKYSTCPENLNPHAIRRGSITYHLLRDWPEGDVSERMNVSSKILQQHYDRRTDKEKLEQRRKNLSKL